jgi:hypothetical protein
MLPVSILAESTELVGRLVFRERAFRIALIAALR